MERKNGFFTGALVGALAMLAVILGLNGGPSIFSKIGGKDGVVSVKTSQKIESIRKIMDEVYLYGDEINEDALQEAIVKGYVKGLKEPYTVYYNEEETNALFQATSGEFGGIGVVVTEDLETGLLTFVTVYEDAPGEAAGFLEGDLVYKVNGEDITGMDMDTVISKIRGKIGTTVEITVLRGENLEEYTATATRALIKDDTVTSEMKDGKVGYILLSSFEDVTYDQFEEALTDLSNQNMQGLVVDLRGNPGGNLSTVCDVLDLILPEGTIVSTKDRNGKGETYKSDEERQLNIPLVVLINEYSASAAEIFAGAVKDYGIGTLVGMTTYGKGIVQNVYKLRDGTSLKITGSEYFTPNGTSIHGVGVKPDVEVKYEYDAANPEWDNQLEKALEVLKNKM